MGALHLCPACPVVVWMVAWCDVLYMIKQRQLSFSQAVVLLQSLTLLGNHGKLQSIKL